MSENTEDKQYKPSERRLAELKKKGTFLRARDLSAGSILIVAIALIIILTPSLYQYLLKFSG